MYIYKGDGKRHRLLSNSRNSMDPSLLQLAKICKTDASALRYAQEHDLIADVTRIDNVTSTLSVLSASGVMSKRSCCEMMPEIDTS